MKLDPIIYENFNRYFPDLADHATLGYNVSPFEILVNMDDGRQMIYNDFDRSIHIVNNSEWSSIDEDEWYSIFLSNLNRLMAERNTSQSWLSRMTGLSNTCINRYVNGKSYPSPYDIYLIAKALRCDVSELFNIRN